MEVIMNYPHFMEGKEILEALWMNRQEEFLKSVDFQAMLAVKALRYYYHGFQTCVRQFASQGYPPAGVDASFLNEEAGLEDAPELEERRLIAEETPPHVEE